jgi:rubrerythrin
MDRIPKAGSTGAGVMQRWSREVLLDALEEHGRAAEVARRFNISRERVRQLMHKFGLVDEYFADYTCQVCEGTWRGVESRPPQACPRCKSKRWRRL